MNNKIAQKAYWDCLDRFRNKKVAQKYALDFLMQKYYFQKYEYVEEILLEHFPEKIDWHRERDLYVDWCLYWSQFSTNMDLMSQAKQ